ncbi:DUF3450 domain-containing protein [Idiomarina sp.]|uniref:DUF3450 domain-containing protein n=1 Tax=Idiomarina sp. TaxID=1874361 RepID=UPI0025BDB88D|nr:DUF3450 domain-containing protein [Idiomarina sp.]
MRLLATSTALALAATLSLSVNAQDSNLEPVVENAAQINQSARQSQLTVDTIAESMQERLQQYKQIMKEIDGLQVYTQQLQQQVGSQQQEMDDLNQSLDQVSIVERQVSPLMTRMIDALETFVELDVPFLEKERADRLAGLNDLMQRANVEVSEKFRRVMEAYQIEAEYGRNIEAYSAEHSVNGQLQDVTFLRIGRLALIYKTRDGQQLGIWDQQAREWKPLDNSHLIAVDQAISIARKQKAPDMLMLPLLANKTSGQ